ncbi:MlaD family protein [soil metagenome]
MAIGLSAIALMVVYFGRFGDTMRKYYEVKVEYPNASGLINGAKVLLAGARIGMVDKGPDILPDMDGVSVTLKIFEEIKIPSDSEFTIGSSGLLGDKYVQIEVKKKDSPPIAPGTVVKGKMEAGLADLAEKIGPMLDEAKETIEKIKNVATKVDNDVFRKETLDNINATAANLKETSNAFAEASKKIDGLVAKADGVMKTGQDTFSSAKDAADELKKTIADVHSIIQQTKQGRGALGALLVDKEMAENLKALVSNLRRNGILWYKDKGAEPAPSR